MQHASTEDISDDIHRQICSFQMLLPPNINMPAAASSDFDFCAIDETGNPACIGGFWPAKSVSCSLVILNNATLLQYDNDDFYYKACGDFSVQAFFPPQTRLRAVAFHNKEDDVVLGIYDAVVVDGHEMKAMHVLERHQNILKYFNKEFPSGVQYHWIGNIFQITDAQQHAQNMPFPCDTFFILQDH